MAYGENHISAGKFVELAEKNDDTAMKEAVFFIDNVNGANSIGWTPLICAAYWNMKETMKELLASGADPDRKNSDGYCALIYASEHSDPDAVKILLRSGANPDITSGDGWTPLMWAAFFGHYKTVKVLLDAGADISISNSSAMSVLDIARSRNKEDIEALVEDYIVKGLCPVPIGARDCPGSRAFSDER